MQFLSKFEGGKKVILDEIFNFQKNLNTEEFVALNAKDFLNEAISSFYIPKYCKWKFESPVKTKVFRIWGTLRKSYEKSFFLFEAVCEIMGLAMNHYHGRNWHLQRVYFLNWNVFEIESQTIRLNQRNLPKKELINLYFMWTITIV